MLSTVAEPEMRYYYMKLWMKYYDLTLNMECILSKFGVEPDFDWFEKYERGLA